MLKLLVILSVLAASLKCTDYRRNVIDGLDQVLGYIMDNHKHMNIDALFGLVLTQAHLHAISANGYSKQTGIYKTKIMAMEMTTKRIIEMTKRYIKSTYKNDLFMATILLPKMWNRDIRFHLGLDMEYNVNDTCTNTYRKYLKYLATSYFEESYSDACFVELLEQRFIASRPCSICKHCKNYMIDDDHIDPAYGVTHRLLYLQIARTQNCSFNKTSAYTNRRINLFCSHIFWEAFKNFEFGYIDELDDLFLEQVTLCGYEGFEEFLGDDFIEHILSIQTEHGCFKVPPLDQDYTGENARLKRHKRDANLIKYGCNDHSTGLGAAALSLILRYLLGFE